MPPPTGPFSGLVTETFLFPQTVSLVYQSADRLVESFAFPFRLFFRTGQVTLEQRGTVAGICFVPILP
jgi:hypothetical protein